MQIDNLAETLNNARISGIPIPQITKIYPDLTLEDAYKIQTLGINLRKGEKFFGFKVGLTSLAKRQQMNLHKSIYGVLTDKMRVYPPTFFLEKSIHPKVEPELAFFIGEEVNGEINLEMAQKIVRKICPALEIIDSRYEQFKYFSLSDVVSDNSSSSHFLIEESKDFLGKDLGNLRMALSINHKIEEEGFAKAVLDNPLNSLVELSKLRENIPQGSWVLSGAVTSAIPLLPGMNVSLLVDGEDVLNFTYGKSHGR